MDVTAPLLSLTAARANHLVTDWDNLQIPVPWFVGRRFVEPAIEALVPFIDWNAFLAAWHLDARDPAVLEHPPQDGPARALIDRAEVVLRRFLEAGPCVARGVYGFWPANSVGDDIVVYRDDARARELVRFHMLRQQEEAGAGRPNLSLADFVAPRDSFAPDYIGAFAVTAGNCAGDFAREYESHHDAEAARIATVLGERLADAFAAYLHAQVRRDWGHAADGQQRADNGEHRGIRTSFGEPACPDRSNIPALFRLLHADEVGVTLTESFATAPAASVSGIYLSHPAATGFDVGRLGRDQIEDYAQRQGVTIEQAESWLASNLHQ